MREIKFRVWDTKENKFFEPTYEAYKGKLQDLQIGLSGVVCERTLEGISMVEWQNGRWLIQQYTGLKDKNGKEIYEGDVVAGYEGNPKAPRFEVTFDRGCFLWGGEPLTYSFDDQDEDGMPAISKTEKWATVIGNIYENPELLK